MTQIEIDYMRSVISHLPQIAYALERIADSLEQMKKVSKEDQV